MQTTIPRSINLTRNEITIYREELRKCKRLLKKEGDLTYRGYSRSAAESQIRKDIKFYETAIKRFIKASSGHQLQTGPPPLMIKLQKQIKQLSNHLKHTQIGEIIGANEAQVSNLMYYNKTKLSRYMRGKVESYLRRLERYNNRN